MWIGGRTRLVQKVVEIGPVAIVRPRAGCSDTMFFAYHLFREGSTPFAIITIAKKYQSYGDKYEVSTVV